MRVFHGKRSVLSLLALLAFVFALAAGAEAQEGAAGALEDLIERQESMESVRASFVQEQYDPMLGRPLKSEGDFYFRSGRGVRWEYADALVIYDGEVLYVYSPEAQEAQKIEGKKGFMGPLAFDIESLREAYEMEARRLGGIIGLELRPREEMPFASMTMIFPEGRAFPSEVTVVQATGEKATIRFEDIELNAGFSDEVFVFSPPEGTTITERRFE